MFELLRRKPQGRHVFLFAFDLLELDGEDLRREPFDAEAEGFQFLRTFTETESGADDDRPEKAGP